MAADVLTKAWAGAPARPVVKRQVELSMAAIPSYPGKPAGWIDPSELKKGYEMLLSVGDVKGSKPLEAYYSDDLFAK